MGKLLGRKVYVFLILSFYLSGCMPLIRMVPSPLSPASIKSASILVGNVTNMRTEGKGDKNCQLLGRVRGGFGNPFALNTKPGREIDIVLKEALSNALKNTGNNTEPEEINVPLRMDLDIMNFWCDGYAGYKIEAIIVAKLINVANGNILISKEIHSSEGFSLMFGNSSMHKAFNKIASSIENELVSFLNSDEFRTAAKK